MSHTPSAPEWMDRPTKERLRTAADRAITLYPGPVGELLHQELLSWMVFGHLLGSTLIMRLIDDLTVQGPSARMIDLPDRTEDKR